jgi:hypothetical protein
MIKLFRGLEIPHAIAQGEIDSIRVSGIVDRSNRRSNSFGIVKPPVDALRVESYDFAEEIWDRNSFSPFACADVRSASRYSKTTPTELGVQMEVDPYTIYVDGRDFLFYSFQRVDCWIDVANHRDLMAQAFGKRILEWAERAAMLAERPSTTRVNVACHACQDLTW